MEKIFLNVINPKTPKIFGIAFNYTKHTQAKPALPPIFTKSASCLTLPNQDTVNFSSKGRKINHEIELGIMFSKEFY